MRYCGRDFSATEMESIRALIRDHPGANRARLSRLVCEVLDWQRPDGRLKAISCRVATAPQNCATACSTLSSSNKSRSRDIDRVRVWHCV